MTLKQGILASAMTALITLSNAQAQITKGVTPPKNEVPKKTIAKKGIVVDFPLRTDETSQDADRNNSRANAVLQILAQDQSFLCTGTLIAPDMVLTAASCFEDGKTERLASWSDAQGDQSGRIRPVRFYEPGKWYSMNPRSFNDPDAQTPRYVRVGSNLRDGGQTFRVISHNVPTSADIMMLKLESAVPSALATPMKLHRNRTRWFGARDLFSEMNTMRLTFATWRDGYSGSGETGARLRLTDMRLGTYPLRHRTNPRNVRSRLYSNESQAEFTHSDYRMDVNGHTGSPILHEVGGNLKLVAVAGQAEEFALAFFGGGGARARDGGDVYDLPDIRTWIDLLMETPRCTSIDPDQLEVGSGSGTYFVSDTRSWRGKIVVDAHENADAATQALRFLQTERIDKVCTMSQPGRYYFLRGERLPTGTRDTDGCDAIRPRFSRIEQIGGDWRMNDGGFYYFQSPDTVTRTGASSVTSYIGLKHDLAMMRDERATLSCRLGEGRDAIQYLRRH